MIANRLMKQLAIPLSNPKTVAKWLVISPQAGKSLVIPEGEGYGSSLREFHVKKWKTLLIRTFTVNSDGESIRHGMEPEDDRNLTNWSSSNASIPRDETVLRMERAQAVPAALINVSVTTVP